MGFLGRLLTLPAFIQPLWHRLRLPLVADVWPLVALLHHLDDLRFSCSLWSPGGCRGPTLDGSCLGLVSYSPLSLLYPSSGDLEGSVMSACPACPLRTQALGLDWCVVSSVDGYPQGLKILSPRSPSHTRLSPDYGLMLSPYDCSSAVWPTLDCRTVQVCS